MIASGGMYVGICGKWRVVVYIVITTVTVTAMMQMLLLIEMMRCQICRHMLGVAVRNKILWLR